MAYVLLDLDTVLDNAEFCNRVLYSLREMDDGAARFVIVAGSLAHKRVLGAKEAKAVKARIEKANAEALITLGRRKFIEFEDWESLEKLATW